MTYLVPFDGSDLSKAALHRASEFASVMDEELIVLTVIPPGDVEFAIERGWVDETDPYDADDIASALEAAALEVAPEAEFRVEFTEDVSSVASHTTDVVRTIRSVANELDTDIIFIGSENAGRVSTPVSSVGAPVSEDPSYDVHIVRHARAEN